MIKRYYWTNEELSLEAKKYLTRGAFRTGSRRAYRVASNRGILGAICFHMPESFNVHWTISELKREAKKYKRRSEFESKNRGAYDSARRRGKEFLNKICSHMPKHMDQSGENNPRYKWSFDALKKEALRYQTRTEFAKGSPGAYEAAAKRIDFDEICEHMKILGNISGPEMYLFDKILTVFPNTKRLRKRCKIKDKDHIKGFDLDIYVNGKGIEFDGTYWHSVKGLKRSRENWPESDIVNYHQIKDDYFLSLGIPVLHITEREWNTNKEDCIDKCLVFLRS